MKRPQLLFAGSLFAASALLALNTATTVMAGEGVAEKGVVSQNEKWSAKFASVQELETDRRKRHNY